MIYRTTTRTKVLRTFNYVPRHHEVPDDAWLQCATKIDGLWVWEDFVGPLASIAQ